VTATHAAVTELTRKLEGLGQKLYMDNFSPSPELFDKLVKKEIYCCGTVRPNRKGMLQDLRREDNKIEKGRLSR